MMMMTFLMSFCLFSLAYLIKFCRVPFMGLDFFFLSAIIALVPFILQLSKGCVYMVFTLQGFNAVSFSDKSTGEVISGTRFYFSGDDGSRGLVGNATFDFFMTTRRLEQIGFTPDASDVGSEYEIFYNRFGKVADIRSVYDKL